MELRTLLDREVVGLLHEGLAYWYYEDWTGWAR